MKEVLKEIKEILLFIPAPKYLSIPLGVLSSIVMKSTNDFISENLELKQYSWNFDKDAGEIEQNQQYINSLGISPTIWKLSNILGLICFTGLAITEIIQGFNIIPKPVGMLLLLVGGFMTSYYYKVSCAFSRDESLNNHFEEIKEDKVFYSTLCGVAACGGVYLAREGIRALVSER